MQGHRKMSRMAQSICANTSPPYKTAEEDTDFLGPLLVLQALVIIKLLLASRHHQLGTKALLQFDGFRYAKAWRLW